MSTVALWSGREVRALREARRMSVREFSEHLGVSDRMVSKWEAGGETIRPRPVNQSALDTSLHMGAPEVQHRFTALTSTPVRTTNGATRSAGHDVGDLARHPLDGKLMVRIESGPLQRKRGPGPVWVPAFYVDVDLVTVGEYARYRAAVIGHELTGCADDEPVLGLSWRDVHEYARWAGKQIITHDQWDRYAVVKGGLAGSHWEWCASSGGPLRRGSRRGGPGGFRTVVLSTELHQLLSI